MSFDDKTLSHKVLTVEYGWTSQDFRLTLPGESP